MNIGKREIFKQLIQLINYLFKFIRVGIEQTMGESQNSYLAATSIKKQPIREEPAAPTPMATHSDSDSDSN